MNGIETRTATRRASFGRADSARSAATRQGFAPAQTQAPLIDIRQMAARSFAVMGRNTVPFLALIAAAAAPERILYHTMNLHSATTFVP